MLYMSNARISRRAKRWAWANRPYQSIDNPVKRYLRDSIVDRKPWLEQFFESFGRKLRPAY